MKKLIKNTFIILISIVILFFSVIFLSYFIVDSSTEKYVYSEIENLPYNKVGVVMGTSKYLGWQRENLFFKYRIEAATQLYKAGKVKYLLLSGDNSIKNYNEPQMMKETLIQNGVPDSLLILDYAGFRTLDAVVRAKEVFCEAQFTVISQEFHNERAVYIARQKGIEAIAFNAKEVNFPVGGQTRMREYFARIKMFLDLYILNVQPKFLGDKIRIGGDSTMQAARK